MSEEEVIIIRRLSIRPGRLLPEEKSALLDINALAPAAGPLGFWDAVEVCRILFRALRRP